MPNIDIKQLSNSASAELPPVHTWQPDFCGDMDMLIKSNGDWLHEGRKITRPAMVKMFSRILWREQGEHFLVTPVEKVRIQVEDAPFLVTAWQWQDSAQGPVIAFTCLTEEVLLLGIDCDMWMADHDGEERPYISMRYGMKALIGRSVFYDLANELQPVHCPEGEGMGLVSAGKAYLLMASL